MFILSIDFVYAGYEQQQIIGDSPKPIIKEPQSEKKIFQVDDGLFEEIFKKTENRQPLEKIVITNDGSKKEHVERFGSGPGQIPLRIVKQKCYSDQDRQRFVDNFNRLSDQEKIKLLLKGVFWNPKTGLFRKKFIDLGEEQKKIWFAKLQLPKNWKGRLN
jgi:hypothetical protein